MALADIIAMDLVKSLATGPSDSPLAWQVVDYLDSNGNPTGDRGIKVRLFNNSGATVKGGVYMVTYTGLNTTNPQVIDVAAQSVNRNVVVADAIYADQTWGWFFVAGYCDALVDGDATDVIVGDFLGLVAATNADAFIRDGAGSALTTDSFAIAHAANASTEALKKVFLIGGVADID